MKQQLIVLSQRYGTALRKHLKPGPRANLQPALALGRQAVALGLETLALARIHEQALADMALSKSWHPLIKRAERFFNEAIIPIAETHRAAQQSKANLQRVNATLDRRTTELAESNCRLQRGVSLRKGMAAAAEKNGRHYRKCLEESLQLQLHLRQLTHRVLVAQEDERHKISHELQDEIAQTLLGINVRLLSLKQKSRSRTQGLKDEIASTQRLVLKSARSVRRFARELDLHQPAQNDSLLMTRSLIAKNPISPTRPGQKTDHPSGANLLARNSFPVIAMAASAGGLKALSAILGGLPADFPAAIAIVMHVAPDHKSLLAEILNSRSHLPVTEAHNGDLLSPARIFVAPPNHHLFVANDGRLKLSSVHAKKNHFSRPSAEPLFATVARVYKKNAIAVVLTGGDGDGSFGVQIIKDQSGTVIAQDRPTSENFSMPETTIKTGDVDFILPLDEIAPTLIALVWGSQKSRGCRPMGKGRMPAPASPAKCATPHYAASRKTVML